ncbi:hypothetical protein PFUGPA_02377 [Plasmodium falciparum Palo Alto/Uganda]|uniref:Uncharacterized protein n=2 Tax=Plasmodium falciparum TaxID=5833 RepID=W4J1X6_PLAFP|nr:hypothetical protein PFFVO_04349 [Plasmodium falciparum Vietnam Oak-Knoll (FVO)]ETW55612.1 hypothetical protein PFUGPA_02377 [Plasmodium falciparum Palo Alto/Uganda]
MKKNKRLLYFKNFHIMFNKIFFNYLSLKTSYEIYLYTIFVFWLTFLMNKYNISYRFTFMLPKY